MSLRYFYILSVIFFGASLFVSIQVVQLSQQYKASKEVYTNDLNYRSRFLDPDEWVSKEKAAAKLDNANATIEKIDEIKRLISRASLLILGMLLVYLILAIISFRKSKDYRILVLSFILSALACLPVGLFAPMLEIAAFERNLNLGEIPINARVMGFNVTVEVAQEFAGDMYFYYQSKSVIELISLLFQQQNFIVGISILLFSVLFPLSKVLLTLGLVFRPQIRKIKWIYYVVEKSGKWSMADVFVVAVFLAFLAFSNMQVGITTESRVLVGLYFFLGYCLLSLSSSVWIRKIEEG